MLQFFFFLVIGVNVIGYWDLFYVFCGGWVLVGSWLGWACFCYDCDYFLILILCFYIYILVIDNIMNKSLFMHVEIAKNLVLFGETTTILFI